MNILKTWLITSLTILLASYLLPGISVENFLTAIITAAVLGLLNTFLKPILLLFSIPANIITFGLFTFAINAFIIMIVHYLIADFTVANFWWALLLGLIISFVNSLTSQK